MDFVPLHGWDEHDAAATALTLIEEFGVVAARRAVDLEEVRAEDQGDRYIAAFWAAVASWMWAGEVVAV